MDKIIKLLIEEILVKYHNIKEGSGKSLNCKADIFCNIKEDIRIFEEPLRFATKEEVFKIIKNHVDEWVECFENEYR